MCVPALTLMSEVQLLCLPATPSVRSPGHFSAALPDLCRCPSSRSSISCLHWAALRMGKGARPCGVMIVIQWRLRLRMESQVATLWEKKTRSPFPDSRWYDEIDRDAIGFAMKSRLLKIWHASEKRVGSVPCGSPWDRRGWLLARHSDPIRRRGWLGRPGGNESTHHGRKCVPIICRFCFPLWGSWITVHYQWWQSEKLHCGDLAGFLISFISAGISTSQRKARLEFTFALPLALLRPLLFFHRSAPVYPNFFLSFFS